VFVTISKEKTLVRRTYNLNILAHKCQQGFALQSLLTSTKPHIARARETKKAMNLKTGTWRQLDEKLSPTVLGFSYKSIYPF
tara:strand:+ start:510 stop:755 length:246 start_codon:yes stop_codon:yes gene_type:complete